MIHMTDRELLDSWAQRNGTKKMHLQVLAELNCCSEEEIYDKLAELKVLDLPKKPGPKPMAKKAAKKPAGKKTAVKKEPEEKPVELDQAAVMAPVPEPVPETVPPEPEKEMSIKTLTKLLNLVTDVYPGAVIRYGEQEGVRGVHLRIEYDEAGEITTCVVELA